MQPQYDMIFNALKIIDISQIRSTPDQYMAPLVDYRPFLTTKTADFASQRNVFSTQKRPKNGPSLVTRVPSLPPYPDGRRFSATLLRNSAGVKGEIELGLAHGAPVVSTSVAAEGIILEGEPSVLLAGETAAFAERLRRIYRDRELWEGRLLQRKGP